MAALVLPNRLRRAPPLGARIDRSNPLARGLLSATYASESSRMYDAALGMFWYEPYPEGSLTKTGVDEFGRWRGFTGSGAYRQTLGSDTPPLFSYPATNQWTALVFVRPTAVNAGPLYIASFGEASGWNVARIAMGNGTDARFSGSSLDSGTEGLVSADSTYTVGQLYAVAYTTNTAIGAQRLFVNGVKQSGSNNSTYTAGKIVTQGVLGPAVIADPYKLYASFFFNRILSDAEIAALSANPWQIFAAPQRTIEASTALALVEPMLIKSLWRRPKVINSFPPQQSPRIDTANPLAKGLVEGFNPATTSYFGRKTSVIRPFGDPGRVYDSQHGIGLSRTDGSFYTALTDFNSSQLNTSSQTMLTVFVPHPLVSAVGNIATLSSSSNGHTWGFDVGNGTNLILRGRTYWDGPVFFGGSFDLAGVTTPQVAVIRSIGGNGGESSIWLNGQKDPVTAAQPASPTLLSLPYFGHYYLYPGHKLFLTLLWDRALTDAEIRAISKNPWQVFASPTRKIGSTVEPAPAPSGGSTFNTGFSDVLSALESLIANYNTATSGSDTGAATDTTGFVGSSLTAAQTETSSAADTGVGSTSTTGAVSESGASADTPSSSASYSAASTENGTASESESTSLSTSAASAETGAANDVTTNGSSTNVSTSETGAATDTGSATGALNASGSEAGAAVETGSATALHPAANSDNGSALETEAASANFAATGSEGASAVETGSATSSSGGLTSSDTLNAIDAASTSGNITTGTINESSTANETTSDALATTGITSESVTTLDQPAASNLTSSSITEFGSVVDTYQFQFYTLANFSDTLSATETSGLGAGSSAVSISESANAVELISTTVSANLTQAELVSILDTIGAVWTGNADSSDALTVNDIIALIGGQRSEARVLHILPQGRTYIITAENRIIKIGV